ncbi:MAG: four helix bundle protein [Clostridia bacterium]
MFIYRKLDVWHLAKNLAIKTYQITKTFPQEEKFTLTSQINRSAVSVPSNIAEGCSRTSFKDQAHFSEIAYGSLMELACQMEIAKDLGYMEESELELILADIETLAVKLSNYKRMQVERILK